MTQPAKAQEPSMEEILASIRRIIADDDTAKTKDAEPAKKPAEPPRVVAPAPARPPAPAPVESAPQSQDDIDALLADLNAGAADDASGADDVLELTESMAAPEPSFKTVIAQPDVEFQEPAVEAPRLSKPPPSFAQRKTEPEEAAALLSSHTTAAVDSAFNTLAHTVLIQNARTLEDLVREMLRPMLKSWLDDNLPGLVERLVRAEIERVSRGRT